MSDDLTDAQAAAIPEGYSQLNWRRLFEHSLEGFTEEGLARRQSAVLTAVGLS